MTDDDTGPVWAPTMFAESLKEAGEQAQEAQMQTLQRMLDGAGSFDVSQLGAMSQMATFKTRVQSGGRLSIPDAEREALDIQEGDIVQTIVVPVKRDRSDTQ